VLARFGLRAKSYNIAVGTLERERIFQAIDAYVGLPEAIRNHRW